MTSSVPVVLIVFNRPDLTAQTLARILEVSTGPILVVGDGPRSHVVDDDRRVQETHEVVRQLGGARVVLDGAPENLGLRRNYVRAVDRLMGEHGRGIILEDDTLPHPSFFPYVAELLVRYAEDERIGSICGQRVPPAPGLEAHSYGFCHIPPPWGWATWARAWKDHARALEAWPALKASGHLEVLLGAAAAREWSALLDHAETTDSYWIRWVLAHWVTHRLAAVPHVNLIENVGFDERGTFTQAGSRYAERGSEPARSLAFPLAHPPHLAVRYASAEDDIAEAALPFSTRRRRLKQLLLEGPRRFWVRQRRQSR